MRSLIELEKLGYTFSTDGERLEFKAAAPIEPVIVMPLLEELRKHKPEAIAFLQSQHLDLRLQYNTLLAREQKGEKYLDDPIRTPEEIEKWTPEFQKILAGLNRLIDEIGITNCITEERMHGFDVTPYIGTEVGLGELPSEWRS